jgi:hypothetical protein
MAERFHWTLAEVDALSMGDLYDYFEIEEAKANARKKAK